MDLTTRDQAVELGLSHYFTGIACQNGHVAKRAVKTWVCHGCIQMRNTRRDPEVNRQAAKKWRGENLMIARERDRVRYAADPQKRRSNVKAWRDRNPDYNREYTSEWQKANPEKVRAYTNNRRARKLAAEGTHTPADVARILRDQRGRCAHPWCRVKLDRYHVDHIIALSVGGTNWPDNLQILCAPCNWSKSAKDPIVHARQHGMLL